VKIKCGNAILEAYPAGTSIKSVRKSFHLD
jgi:hypothetical protein